MTALITSNGSINLTASRKRAPPSINATTTVTVTAVAATTAPLARAEGDDHRLELTTAGRHTADLLRRIVVAVSRGAHGAAIVANSIAADAGKC